MKVYLAAQYARRNELRKYAALFEKAGIGVTSRWLEETNPLNTQMGDDTAEFYRETAKIDLEDLGAADAVVFFAEDPKVGIPRGGRHVEFGYALGLSKPIFVVGPKENVFHYLQPEAGRKALITHYESVEHVIAELAYRAKVSALFHAAINYDLATRLKNFCRR